MDGLDDISEIAFSALWGRASSNIRLASYIESVSHLVGQGVSWRTTKGKERKIQRGCQEICKFIPCPPPYAIHSHVCPRNRPCQVLPSFVPRVILLVASCHTSVPLGAVLVRIMSIDQITSEEQPMWVEYHGIEHFVSRDLMGFGSTTFDYTPNPPLFRPPNSILKTRPEHVKVLTPDWNL